MYKWSVFIIPHNVSGTILCFIAILASLIDCLRFRIHKVSVHQSVDRWGKWWFTNRMIKYKIDSGHLYMEQALLTVLHNKTFVACRSIMWIMAGSSLWQNSKNWRQQHSAHKRGKKWNKLRLIFPVVFNTAFSLETALSGS